MTTFKKFCRNEAIALAIAGVCILLVKALGMDPEYIPLTIAATPIFSLYEIWLEHLDTVKKGQGR